MATTLQSRPVSLPSDHISVKEYHRWEGYESNEPRTELIRGRVLLRLPVSSPQHTYCVQLLGERIRAAVGPGLLVRSECAMTLADSEPQPDLSVVVGKLRDYSRTHPTTAELVIEVCITSLSRDQQKIELYAEAGVPKYWIIFPEEERIKVHTSPRDGRYTEVETYGPGETAVCGAVPSLRVAVDDFLRVSERLSR